MQEIIVYRSPLEAAIWHGMTFEFIAGYGSYLTYNHMAV